jgi:hypothetical protein
MFIFARPDTTARVLDVVRKARPQQLLVVADGPRPEVAGEAERCAATRELLDTVDWDCDVSTNFADHNLGQTRRLETGLDWAFDLTEEAIVVEDDCLPDPTFFAYCDELLERYRDEERLLTVSGDNFQFERPASEDSYFFSRYPHSYGWASWRRAWSLNDPEMSAWPELRETDWLQGIVGEGHSAAYWSHIFELTHRNRDSWDYAWLFTCWVHGMVNAHPNVNLVSNIGVRDDATNTRPELGTVIADLPTEPIGFPLRHPETLAPNSAADDYTEGLLFGGNMAAMFDRLRRTRRKVRARAAR